MNIPARVFTLLLAVLASLPVPAAADAWYGAVDVGTTRYPGSQDVSMGYISTGPFSMVPGEPTHPIGYRLDLGYKFTPNFSVEGGYVYLGSAEMHSYEPKDCIFGNGVTNCIPAQTTDISLRTSGLALDAVGTWPVSEHLSLFAEGGLIYARSVYGIVSGEPQVPSSTTAVSSDANSIEPTFGVGAGWSFSEDLAIRLSWNRYQDLEADDDFSGFATPTNLHYNVNVLALGLVYSF